MEYLTEALVLENEDSAEFDKIVNLYTKELGRITAKAKGARKITSKLIGHLQPLNFIRTRLIEKNGFQIADALAFKKMEYSPESLSLARFIKEMTFELQPDRDLWDVLKRNKICSEKDLLKSLGFDPAFAKCEVCEAKKTDFFSKTEQIFLCRRCASKIPKDEIVLIE